jgi:hypothetical protein
MADSEELRLVASFVDRMSPGLKSSIDKIKSFSKEGAKAGEDGARATTKHAEAFAKLRDRLGSVAWLGFVSFVPRVRKVGRGRGGLSSAPQARRNFIAGRDPRAGPRQDIGYTADGAG